MADEHPTTPVPGTPVSETPPAQPESHPHPEIQKEQIHRSHTFEDDVAKAMNTIDAPVIQEMLATAREREETERLQHVGKTQRHLYSILSLLLVILAAAGFGYGIYHYISLTVPLEHSVPVGVFKNTAPVVAKETNIRELVAGLRGDPTLDAGVPMLVPLVTDPISLAPITKQQFFDFIGSKPTEPFSYAMDTVRLGIINTKGVNTTFIVLSVTDPQLASKEFLIAEPTLLQLFTPALGIDLSAHLAQVGRTFSGGYVYNLPVRMLTETNADTGDEKQVILYGYATENVIVITTDPAVLKAVSDTIIQQFLETDIEILVLLGRHATIGAIMIDTKPLKEKLDAEKKLLEEELVEIARFNTETGQWEAIPDQDLMGEIDDNDAADRFEDFEERTAMTTTLSARLKDINDALIKIESGKYGTCEVDGAPIEKDRLEANPAARTCKEHMNM